MGMAQCISLKDRVTGVDSDDYFEFRLPSVIDPDLKLKVALTNGRAFDFPCKGFSANDLVGMTRRSFGFQAGRITSADSNTASRIPSRVLTAADCDSARPLPPKLSEVPQWGARRFEIKLSRDCGPGDVIKVDLGGGQEQISIKVLEDFVGGETACISQWPCETWRIAKSRGRTSAILPTGFFGGRTKLDTALGLSLSLEVPEDAKPGDLLIFKRCAADWQLEEVRVLPEIAEIPAQSFCSGPYCALLGLLRSKDLLELLPLDGNEHLHVNVPFCGKFREHVLLTDFLTTSVITRCKAKRVSVWASDLCDRYLYDWAIAEKWVHHTHPQCDMKIKVQDLAEEGLPEAGLTVAIHPEVTWGGVWFQIIGSILRSSHNGLCVFAVFYDFELKTLLNMIDMYKPSGCVVEAISNPYYETHELSPSPMIRHVVLVFPAKMS